MPHWEELKQRLSEALGDEAVVCIVDDEFLELKRLFVCLLTRAEECMELRKHWKPCKLLDGKASVTWRDTIDTGSSRMSPRLETCWNSELLADGMSLELPASWAELKGTQNVGKALRCVEGSHWYDFARIFGEVSEVYLVVAARPDTAHLVVNFASKRGAFSAYKMLSGKCLQNPMSLNEKGSKELSVLRAVYGTYSSILAKATLGVLALGTSKSNSVIPLPEPPYGGEGRGPVFELFPLRRDPGTPKLHTNVLQIAPWGPKRVKIGSNKRCDLYICDDAAVSSISNFHAELTLKRVRRVKNPMTGDQQLKLFISDSSKNGTWVNRQRLPKGKQVELQEGSVVCFAEVSHYVSWRSMGMLGILVSYGAPFRHNKSFEPTAGRSDKL